MRASARGSLDRHRARFYGGVRPRLGGDGRSGHRPRTWTRCWPTPRATRGASTFPGHKGGPGADPGLRELAGDAALSHDIPALIQGIDVGERADPVPAGAAACGRGLGRAAQLVSDQRRLAGKPGGLPGARPPRRAADRPAQRPLLGDRRAGARRAAPDVRRSRARPRARRRPLPDRRTRSPRRSTSTPTRSARSSSPPPTSAPAPTSRRWPTSRHERDVPLVVDEAWGAHLQFHPDLPPDAL